MFPTFPVYFCSPTLKKLFISLNWKIRNWTLPWNTRSRKWLCCKKTWRTQIRCVGLSLVWEFFLCSSSFTPMHAHVLWSLILLVALRWEMFRTNCLQTTNPISTIWRVWVCMVILKANAKNAWFFTLLLERGLDAYNTLQVCRYHHVCLVLTLFISSQFRSSCSRLAECWTCSAKLLLVLYRL
jgi:hypothetical protein